MGEDAIRMDHKMTSSHKRHKLQYPGNKNKKNDGCVENVYTDSEEEEYWRWYEWSASLSSAYFCGRNLFVYV